MVQASQLPLQYILSPREHELLRQLVRFKQQRGHGESSLSEKAINQDQINDTHNASAFRSASRLFLATTTSLSVADAVLSQLASASAKRNASRSLTPATPRPASKPLVASKTKLAFSLSSLLFLHRVLFRLFSRIRAQLLHHNVRDVMMERYPRVYRMLTSRLAPAVGASLSGLALGICTADQLRITIAIWVACRACERLYEVLDERGYLQKKPRWLGSWVLFALSQGQLLHAFVFDRDCFPEAYGSLILKNSSTYVARRPEKVSAKVVWPTSNQIVDSLAEMARLKWPPLVSPILHPDAPLTLPKTIDPVISPITSRANPAHRRLACALIHGSEPSCFTAYLQQNLTAFPQLARFFAIYYGALSVLRYKQFFKSPTGFILRLAKQVLKTTMAVSGAIGMSWGSICLFGAIFPRSFLPQFRFVLGGLLGGLFQLFDLTSTGHANALYAARTSVDSLWKVGVKHRWWRSIRGGDVLLFVAALAVSNASYDLQRDGKAREDGVAMLKILRGEIDLGLSEKQPTKDKKERTD